MTPRECVDLMEMLAERRAAETRAATLRAGLVAASVYNVNRRRGARAVQPKDFIKAPPKIVTPGEMEQALDAWMTSQNTRRA